MGHELFPPDMNPEFQSSVCGIIFPRVAVAAGAYWNYDTSLDVPGTEFNEMYDNFATVVLRGRGVDACPVGCTCNEVSRCGKPYIH